MVVQKMRGENVDGGGKKVEMKGQQRGETQIAVTLTSHRQGKRKRGRERKSLCGGFAHTDYKFHLGLLFHGEAATGNAPVQKYYVSLVF